MPVSHIGLTVSHLPTSCSFYLAALQPLGYRYIGQQDDKIGLGARDADFFICQDSPGTKVGPAHVAFAAHSREEVDSFFSAALKAGGEAHGEPKQRDSETGYYSAAVLDFDDNSVEVVHRDSEKAMSIALGAPSSRWIEDAPRSTVSTVERGPLRTLVNNITTTITSTTRQPTPTKISDSSDSRALVGTLLGAAAGAAIAYVMTKEESFNPSPFTQRPEIVRRTTIRHTFEGSPQPLPSTSIHGRDSVSYVSEASSKHTARPRAIGAAESVSSDAQSKTSHRNSKPLAIEAPRSVVSEAQSKASHKSSKPSAIEAPPSMISATSSRRSKRMIPPAPTFYTVQGPSEAQEPEEVMLPSSSHVTKASKASRASKAPSIRSTSTIKTVRTAHRVLQEPLPRSIKTSTYTIHAHEVPLPQSTKTSTYTTHARDVPLPESVKTSVYEEEAHNYPLPPSTHQSHTTHRSSTQEKTKSPSKASRAARDPWDVPLPMSARTSFISRARSPPRSAASASTVKPLTRHNIRRAATDNGVDDLDTVVPEDSISQAGSKPKSKHHRRRSDGGKSVTSRASRKPSSKVSMPRSIGRAFGVTA